MDLKINKPPSFIRLYFVLKITSHISLCPYQKNIHQPLIPLEQGITIFPHPLNVVFHKFKQV